MEQECTFVASSNWPVAGLEAGPGYLYYPRLVGATATAEGLNVTCPPGDWAALLDATASMNDSGGALAPCGTATVSSGQDLLAALKRLQPSSARVLISLAANTSLPAQPTPQRVGPAPGDDDDVPLVVMYRNTTLAGGLRGRTELDLRGRRNAFGLQAGWQLLQQQGAQQQLPAPSSSGGSYWRGRPVLVMADLTLVNAPPGPPSSWPLGLLGSFHFYAGLDRGGGAGLQLIGLRAGQVFRAIDIGYMGFWYTRMVSLLASERDSAAWLQSFMDPLQAIPDILGGRTVWGHVGDYVLAYNSSASPVPLLTPPGRADYDLYSSAPAGSLTGASNGTFTYTYALPPASFATAGNASQLLRLLQDAWTGGPRVIFLLNNITLNASEWPQGGAGLSYNVTLAGPVSGPLVQLDTAGMSLVHAAGPSAGAGGGGANGTGGRVVVLLLQRLELLGLAPQLLVASREGVVAAAGALDGSTELQDWRDSCLQSAAEGGTAAQVLWELRNCTLSLEGPLQLLRRYNDPAACAQDASSLATATKNSSSATETALCSVMRSLLLPEAVRALLRQSLAVDGQATFIAGSASNATPSINFALATLGGFTFADSVAITGPPPDSPGQGSDSAEAITTEPACGVAALLVALLPHTSPAPAPSRGSRAAAVAGGAAAGSSVAALCLAGVAVALTLRRRRRHGPPDAAPPKAGPAQAADAQDSDSPKARLAVRGGEEGIEERGDRLGAAPEAAAVTVGASTEMLISTDDDGLTFSLSTQAERSGSAARAATTRTMAESVLLGGAPARGAARGGGGGGLLLPDPLRAATGNRPQQKGVNGKGAAGPERCGTTDEQAGIMATGSSTKSSSQPNSLRSTMAEEIEAMMRRCQAMVPGTPTASKLRNGRLQLLGRGAHGVVYLGEWRGLPAAIKTVLLGEDASPARRERLVREVALTMTLNHPHIVPTYNFEVHNVPIDDGAPLDRHLTSTEVDRADDDPDLAALRLKLVMQYCEGGTLRAALQNGHFSTPPLTSGATPMSVPSPSGPSGAARNATAAATGGSGEAEALEPRPLSRATGPQLGPVEPARAMSRLPSSRPDANSLRPTSSQPVASTLPRNRPLEWADVGIVPNLPLALLAASDILRGLEYLHGCGVVHGDLTENNVLLKAAQPVLPQPQPSSLAAQSLLRNNTPARFPQHAGLGSSGPSDGGDAGGGTPQKARAEPGAGVPSDGCSLGTAAPPLRQQQQWQAEQEQQRQQPRPLQDIAHCASRSRVHASSSSEVVVTLAHNLCHELPAAGVMPATQLTPSVLAPPRSSVQAPTPQVQPFSQGVGASCVWGTSPEGGVSNTSEAGPQTDLGTSLGTSGQPSGPDSSSTVVRELAVLQRLGNSHDGDIADVAAGMLVSVCKIADFGLSVQLRGGSETHLSNMAQGTPFFAAPEVVQFGRLSPAADVYSFGVLLWLLLHGVSLTQMRHLLPRVAYAPISPLLLSKASRALPLACHQLLATSMAIEPEQRPKASQLRHSLEDVLRDIAGPQLAWMLLSSERKELTVSPAPQQVVARGSGAVP